MNLEDLKSRATAAELTLINTVLELSEEEAAKAVRGRVVKFIHQHPVPQEGFGAREATIRWVQRLTEAAIGEEK